MLQIICLILFTCINAQNSFKMRLENYNGWNLPFAKTVNVTVTDDELALYVLPDTFKLETTINAYCGVIFTGRPMPVIDPLLHSKEKI